MWKPIHCSIRTKRLPTPLTDTLPHASRAWGARGTWGALSTKADAVRQHTRKAGRWYPRNQSQRIRHLSVQPAPIAPGPLQKTKSWGIPRGHACRPEETAFGNRNTSSKHASALYIREHNTANAQEPACVTSSQGSVPCRVRMIYASTFVFTVRKNFSSYEII